ncbi:unnamed protein product, partial [Lymnaea stagnalis]
HDSTSGHNSTPGHDSTPDHDSPPAHDSTPGHDAPPDHDSTPGHDSAYDHDSAPGNDSTSGHDSTPDHDSAYDHDSAPGNDSTPTQHKWVEIVQLFHHIKSVFQQLRHHTKITHFPNSNKPFVRTFVIYSIREINQSNPDPRSPNLIPEFPCLIQAPQVYS